VTLVDFHQLIAEEAKSLMRAAIVKGWSLKPYDAVHLGTAKRMEIARFQTYDTGLDKYGADFGFSVERPLAAQRVLLPPEGT
jgi:predicted nucleic acid-binding protein